MHAQLARIIAGGAVVLGSVSVCLGADTAYSSKIQPTFELNLGQAAQNVDFLSQGSQFKFELQGPKAVLKVGQKDQLQLTFVGARMRSPQGQRLTETKSNYYLGSNPAKWLSSVPHYAEVKYPSAYPGIDVVYHGAQGQLEYDFVVAPGADPSRISLQFSRAQAIKIDAEGGLTFELSSGRIVQQQKPRVYQDIAGVRREIHGEYMQKRKRVFGFRLGAYDRTKPLIIDPVLAYSTYVPGNGTVQTAAADPAGNLYFATNGEFFDVVVTKLNAAGTALVYRTVIGGSGADSPAQIAVDGSGNAYVCGFTQSNNFAVTPNAPYKTYLGNDDGFALKLNPSGGIVYATYLSSSLTDRPTSIAADNSGAAYVGGWTTASDFPSTTGTYQSTRIGNFRAGFVVKLDPTGSNLVYGTFLKGNGWTPVSGVAVDSSGAAYIAGSTTAADFPVTPGALHASGTPALFVAKLNPSATDVLFSAVVAAPTESISRIALDSGQNVAFMTSGCPSPVTVTPGAISIPSLCDSYLMKINNSGTGILYSARLPVFSDPVFDGADNPVVASAVGIPFPPTTVGAVQGVGGGAGSAFSHVLKLNSQATAILYATFLPVNYVHAAAGADGAVYVAGVAQQGNSPLAPGYSWNQFPVTPGAPLPNPTSNGLVAMKIPMGSACAAELDAGTNLSFPKEGATGTFNIHAPSNCTWTAASDSTWLIFTTDSFGTGNGSVDYKVIASNFPATRLGKFALSDKIYDFTQGGPPCTFQPIAPVTLGLESNLISFTVVTNGPTCAWTASSNAGWATVLDNAGTGFGSFRVAIDPQNLTAPRSATISFMGQSVTLTQPACVYQLDPSQLTIPRFSYNNTIQLFTGSACPWNVSSNAGWLSVKSSPSGTNVTSGTGPRMLTLEAQANPDPAVRIGLLTIGSATLTLAQGGTNCDFAVSDTTRTFPSTGGASELQIAIGEACTWNITSRPPWTSLTGPGAGFGSGSTGFSVVANPSAAPHTGSLVLASSTQTTTLRLVQDGAIPSSFFTDVPTNNSYLTYITLLKDADVTKGCGPTNFCPDDPTTRGQMAAFIVRAVLRSDSFPYSVAPFFEDVPATNSYFPYIQKLKELGITKGCSTTRYCPDDPVTREQMAAFLARAKAGENFPYQPAQYFIDVNAFSIYFPYIQYLKNEGITVGCTADHYCPSATTTRAQMAAFLVRAFLTP